MTTLQTFTKCLGVILVEILVWVSNFSSLNLSDNRIRRSSRMYGGPQLSQQQQITHSNNKLIATITKTSHQNQIAHSTNKMLTAQMKTLTVQTKTHSTNENSHSTNQNSHSINENAHSNTKSRRFIVPLSRFEERGNHLAMAGEDLCRSS